MLADDNVKKPPPSDQEQVVEVAIKFTRDALTMLEGGKIKPHVCARKLVAAAAIINHHEMYLDEKVAHELIEMQLRIIGLEKQNLNLNVLVASGQVKSTNHRGSRRYLHQGFDALVADFHQETGRLPGQTTLTDLMQWLMHRADVDEREAAAAAAANPPP